MSEPDKALDDFLAALSKKLPIKQEGPNVYTVQGGLYSALFGTNPMAGVLCRMLGLTECGNADGAYDVFRFRDLYLTDRGNKIVLYTRGGGNNRWVVWDEARMEPTEAERPEHLALYAHPCFIEAHDDTLDCTYRYFEFRVPEQFQEECRRLMEGREDPPTPTERFMQILDDLRKR